MTLALHFRTHGTPLTEVPLAVFTWPSVPEPGASVRLSGVWYLVTSRLWTDDWDGTVHVFVVAT